MDNKKIGELIAKLRKEKGLTQQELGDKVGVGSRAVSKWECGTTVPDISIINELSEILGISSNELLAGKIKHKKQINNNSKLSNKFKIFIIIFLLIFSISTALLIYNNKSYTYNLTAIEHDKYQVEGYITYKNKEATMYINTFIINDDKLIDMEIKSYEYNITIGNKYILGYGQNNRDIEAQTMHTIYDIERTIKNSYTETIKIIKNELINKDSNIELTITDSKNNTYIYNINISLYKSKKAK